MVAKRGKTSPNASNKKQKKEKDLVTEDNAEEEMLNEKISKVRDVIRQYSTDDDVKELLTEGAKHCFRDSLESRHSIHREFIGMIETNLLQYVHDKEEEKNECKEKIANADKIKEENVNRKNELVEELEEINAKIDSKQEEVDELEKKNDEARESKKAKTMETDEALRPLKEHQRELKETLEKQAIFEDMKSNPPETHDKKSRSLIGEVIAYVTKMGAASSLTISAPVVLAKTREKIRSEFDTNILEEINQLFTVHVSKLKTNIDKETSQHQEVVTALKATEMAADSAQQALNLAEEQLSELKKEKKQIQDTQREIEKKIKNHDKDMNQKKNALEAATGELEELNEVYQSAIQMRDRSSLKVPEVSENQQEEQGQEQMTIDAVY